MTSLELLLEQARERTVQEWGALCDVSAEHMAETKALCEEAAPKGTRVTAHLCDVSHEKQVLAFRDYAWNAYFTNPAYLNYIQAVFGPETVEHIRETARHVLKRKYADPLPA